MYKPGASRAHYQTQLPVFDGNKWDWTDCGDLFLDKEGFEQWKTAFYNVEGWDPDTGHPKRATLEKLGLSGAADILEKNGKLKAPGSGDI